MIDFFSPSSFFKLILIIVIILRIQEEPYIMQKKSDSGEILTGNDSYEGYCKDLADLIAKKLGITCKYIFTLVTSFCKNISLSSLIIVSSDYCIIIIVSDNINIECLFYNRNNPFENLFSLNLVEIKTIQFSKRKISYQNSFRIFIRSQ